jgi:aldose 1-epimerase
MEKEVPPHGIELAQGRVRCVLRAGLGGCVAGMWFGGVPVLRSAPAVRAGRESACFPLVPFSNRVADAQLRWNGRTHALARNFPPEPHAMHGIGWQRPWDTVQCDSRSATLRLAHAGDAHWPFDFTSEQRFRVDGQSVRIALEMTNTGSAPSPAGLGWHPYVVKRAGARVSLRARGRWETDQRSLPTHRTEVDGLDADCDLLVVNHAFDGWHGAAVLKDAALCVSITSTLSRLVLSTQPSKDFVAIEPVSHVPDSFSRADASMGTVVLGPGETFGAEMTIEVRQAA